MTDKQREYFREYYHKRYVDLRSRGLCVDCATEPAEPNRTRCQRCEKVILAKRRARRESFKAAGLCTICGKAPAEENRTLCWKCSAKRRAYLVEYNRRKRGEQNVGE